jgi:hypothetical protein
MTRIIDVAYPCERYALGLRRAGVETVIRYYSRDSVPSAAKRLHLPEAVALAAAGLRIGIVYEGRRGNDIDYFDHGVGVDDGAYARMYAQHTIGQPAGSTIYFGIDTDADPRKGKDEINKRVVPYFEGIAKAFARNSDGLDYVVGVYGSGAVCQALLDAGLVKMTWLAQSTGWAGYQKFLASRQWNMLQAMDTMIAGVKCDPNTAGPGKDIGDFMLVPSTAGTVESSELKYVNARYGLRLRAGPGVDFDVRSLLPYGTAVHPLGTSGEWTSVDLQGDSAADGYVSTGFLSSVRGVTTHLAAPMSLGTASVALSAPLSMMGAPHVPNGDAVRIPTLIQNGSTEAGIAAARVEAKPAVKGYPKNGCAAHLSALLRQSSIDVPMTVGAGKLATAIEKRGWMRITVGDQQPGDVGVAYGNTDPPGADHIYLVIEAIDDDRMMIADNQNTANAPHARSAHGRDGKTGTDYFLRA